MSTTTAKKDDARCGPREGSRTAQLVALEVGGYLTDSVYLPFGSFDRDEIMANRKGFNQSWGKSIQRAGEQQPKSRFALQSFTAVNDAGDLCMTAVIQRTA